MCTQKEGESSFSTDGRAGGRGCVFFPTGLAAGSTYISSGFSASQAHIVSELASDECASPAEGGLLGNTTGTSATLDSKGVFQPAILEDAQKKVRAGRARRWALKYRVNREFPESRTAACHRVKLPQTEVQVNRSLLTCRAYYSNLMRCGSVWLCPLCASKISEYKRAELTVAIATVKAMGWQVFFATYTIPHGMGDDAKVIVERMLKSYRFMMNSRRYREFCLMYGIEGTVRRLEVTYGINGFHPHFHVLVFAKTDQPVAALQASLLPLWQDACVKQGLDRPSDEHGLKVDDGSYAAVYAAKMGLEVSDSWGLADELTKAHMKQAKGDHKTPWELLESGNIKAFKRYYEAFKGKRQLYWSNGLRAKLAVLQELSDEEIAGRDDDEPECLAYLQDHEWEVILKHRKEAELLSIAETDPNSILSFIDNLSVLDL